MAPSRAEARVALVAEEREGALGCAWTEGFRRAGITVQQFPYANWVFTPGGACRRLKGSRLLRPALRRLAEQRLVRELSTFRPTVVVIVKCDDLHAGTYSQLKRVLRVPIVAFHPDSPFNQRSLFRKGSSHPRALVQVSQVDHYLIWSRRLIPKLQRYSGGQVHYFPFAGELYGEREDPAEGEPVEVSFIGNWDREREDWLASLVAREEFSVKVWGSDYWEARCTTPEVVAAWQGKLLFDEELARVIRASKINLNILRHQNKQACNMRTFEIPACGGFMLHEHSEEAALIFKPGQHADYFSSRDELASKVEFYLRNEATRERIRLAGRELAEGHTYTARARELLSLVAPAPQAGASVPTGAGAPVNG